MPVRVLFCVDTVGPEAGTEGSVVEIVRRLDRGLFEPYLACLEDSPRLRDLSGVCRTAVFPVDSLISPNGLRQMFRLRRYAAAHGIQVVHTFMPKSSLFGTAAASRSRVLVTSRRSLPGDELGGALPLLRASNRLASRILANSEAVRSEVIRHEGLPPDKVDVLYSGVDLNRFAPAPPDPGLAASLGLPPGAPVVIVVATFRRVKGHELFLDAARLVARAVPGCVFLLAGHGEQRQVELERRASALGIRDRVIFRAAGRETVPGLLRLSTVGCLASEREGFSNALLEYMAAGLPVVATAAGGNAEAVADGVTGFLVKTRDPAAFAEPVIRLLQDPALRARMGSAGRERCRRQFDIRESIARLQEYYVSLTASGRKAVKAGGPAGS